MTQMNLSALNRREFFELSGAGLLIWVTAPTAEAQRGTSGAATLEARLHIGEDGAITILTGKVEEGQGPRTELAMAAAEELRVPLESVQVVMADTDVTPNDGITAGSRTTPGTVPAVRKAAAAARELLREAATRQGKPTLSYGELARTPELAKAYKEALPAGVAVTAAAEWRTLSTPHVRVNARDIVTGAHRYPSDIVRPNMLYGSVLRPPAYGATLVTVDLEAGKKTPGAIPAREGAFVGCAAPTSFAARQAVASIATTAQWKTEPHPSSNRLFEHLKEHAGQGRERAPSAETEEEMARRLSEAKTRLKASYQVAYVQHAPMEPRAAVAEWRNEKLTVWTGTSNPFAVREQLAQAFRIPEARVRVIVPDMGGGFGGKHTGEVAIEAARLAREAARPVSLRWTRAEEFTWAYFRPAALIEVQAGLDGNNKIVVWDFANYNSGNAALDTPYRIPNARSRYVSSEPPLRQGSYRALAATANNFARESFTDELAAAAGADPYEFRMAHLDNQRLKGVLQAAAERFRWAERRRRQRNSGSPARGIGLACGTEKNSVVAACVEIEIDASGGTPRLLEICEAFECGAILNPAGLRAQVEGCIMMGLGAALREEILFENGRLTNGRFSAYQVPRFRDLPKMDLLFLDKKDQDPVGAGETPIMAVAPAIANAVFDATGRRVRSMPVRL